MLSGPGRRPDKLRAAASRDLTAWRKPAAYGQAAWRKAEEGEGKEASGIRTGDMEEAEEGEGKETSGLRTGGMAEGRGRRREGNQRHTDRRHGGRQRRKRKEVCGLRRESGYVRERNGNERSDSGKKACSWAVFPYGTGTACGGAKLPSYETREMGITHLGGRVFVGGLVGKGRLGCLGRLGRL